MRTLNRAAALLLALAVAALGAVLATEAVLAWLDRPPLLPYQDLSRALRRTTVGDTAVLAASIAALALGVVVLFLQLRPWRPVRLPAKVTGWYLRRRSAQRSLAAAVARLPAVTAVRARLGRRWRLRLRAAADARDREAVREAAVAELDRLGATDTSRFRLRLTRRRVV